MKLLPLKSSCPRENPAPAPLRHWAGSVLRLLASRKLGGVLLAVLAAALAAAAVVEHAWGRDFA